MKAWSAVLLVLASCGSGGVTDPSHVPVVQSIAAAVLIQPSDTSCAPALCSGGDALVTASLANAPFASQTLRFASLNVDVGIIDPDGIATPTADVRTDAQGKAQVRIKTPASAPTQIALLQITDLDNGAFQRTAVTVVQPAPAALLIVPVLVSFAGPNTNQCASTGSADVYVFGGIPPYTVAGNSDFTVSPSVVTASGRSFNVKPLGNCAHATIPVIDSTGRTAALTAQNLPGVLLAPQTPALTVTPSSVTLGNCQTVIVVHVDGGTGAYVVSATDLKAVYAYPAGAHEIAISRLPKSEASDHSSVTIQSGNEIVTVAIEVPTAALTCP